VTTGLNTLLTALYVKIDDEIGGTRGMGRPPLLSDFELVCLAVVQALLGYHSEARWLRYANKYLSGMFLSARYSSLEKCLRLGTDRTFYKPYSPSSKALFHVKRSCLAHSGRKPEASWRQIA
jgi:hypothetical protein